MLVVERNRSRRPQRHQHEIDEFELLRHVTLACLIRVGLQHHETARLSL
jgi:hypothetical protein